MSEQDLLRVENLRFSYDREGKRVLDGLSLRLGRGEVAAILGPNGAGKTTLLHALLGILKPQSGQIWLAGRELESYRRHELSRLVGLAPQIEHVPFDYSVEEYVLMGRAPHLGMLELPTQEDMRLALQALDELGLLGLRGRSFLELSGGERQMVVLARTLTQQVPLLLMDEPLAHLDLSNKGRILSVIRRLSAAGIAVLFTTHEPDMVHGVAQRVVLMRQGRVIASGPTETVMTSEALSQTYGVTIRVLKVEGVSLERLEALL
ncbi:MAG: ABC transporter ATP-binding protein [Chloroflexi bacterium]|nr:ABC transporter ATP-binding protein [Chloroflexota bacterium]